MAKALSRTVGPCARFSMHCRKPHPKAHILDVAKARLNPPSGVVANQRTRGNLAFTGDQTPGLLHLFVLHTHYRTHAQPFAIGHYCISQRARTSSYSNPLRCLSLLSLRIGDVDVPPKTNHVFKAEIPCQVLKQRAVRKSPVSDHRHLHPFRDHFVQRQQCILMSVALALQLRRLHRLPQQRRRPTMSRDIDSTIVVSVSRKARPIQATTTSVRAPTM